MSFRRKIPRRTALKRIAGIGLLSLPVRSSAAPAAGGERCGMGLVSHCLSNLRDARKAASPGENVTAPLPFLESAAALGAGGIQTGLGILDQRQALELRNRAEQLGMYLEGDSRPPESDADLARFDAELRTAAAAGARAVRTVIIPGRRYERFKSLDEFREYEARGRQMLLRAAPVAEKYKLPLAVENHKDQRNGERIALLEQISSQYVGTCVDAGNSLALLEDPIATIEAFAPWAHSVHLKDQALQSSGDGFLLADIPLGQGALDVPRMVQILRRHKPQIRFSLELITRDPLHVPCLNEEYWSTLADVPAADLARTFRLVRGHEVDTLAQVSNLNVEERIRLEERNLRDSLNYARRELKL